MNTIELQIKQLVERKMRNEEIIRLRNADVPVTEIAKRFGITRQRVYRILKPKRKSDEKKN